MNKEKELLITIANLLETKINESNNMFKTKSESDAFIIGYLQGSIRGVVDVIKEYTKE